MPDDGTLGEYLEDWLERQLTQLQPGTWRRAVLPKVDHAPGREAPFEITAWDAGQLRAFLAAIT